MKNIYLPRISFMGTILMVASVATASFVSNNHKSASPIGSLTDAGTNDGPEGVGTCSETEITNFPCNVTTEDGIRSVTTAYPIQSDAPKYATVNNTTQMDS